MTKIKFLICSLALVLIPGFALSQAVVSQPAPAFSVKDANGKVHQLSDYQGKWLVLEWYNKDCPYVKKHYSVNNMQSLQKQYTGKGVAWLTINSGAPGKQGHLDAKATLEHAKKENSGATAHLIDETGVMGKAYGAKTTPHMFVINPQGTVVYAGAIDSNDSSDSKVIPKSTNYVSAALDAGLAGKTIETASTKPYGCSVKY